VSEHAPDESTEPAPGAEHGETNVDPDADTSHGTGSAPEHVPDEDLEDEPEA
jgi:hypothetical protein